jgi:phosphotransacetylase
LIRLAKEYVMRNRPLEELIAKITEITEFMSSRNLTLEQAMTLVDGLKKSLFDTEQEINSAKKREKETRESVEQEMSKDRTTMADLYLLRQFEEQLTYFGIDIRN